MDINNNSGTLYFTLSNINVSYANAIRRVILSDIPTVVIRTFPYEKNDVNIEINTSILNNEIIKQRLSCIPIYIKDLTTELSDYIIEVDVKNDSEQILYVTTADFKIKNLKTDKYLNDETLKQIFPPNPITKQYIDICRLKPSYSDTLIGEQLKFTAKLSIGQASENGSFNVVSTCSYRNTPDEYKISEIKENKLSELQSKYDNEQDVQFYLKDWLNLDAKRIFMENSFDFKIKTIGVFDNIEIVIKAIKILIDRLVQIKTIFSTSNNSINNSDNTIENSFDITLINEDYTIGKIIEYSLYELYYIGNGALTFCGFRKPHPHINQSIIRIAFKETTEMSKIIEYISNAIDNSILYFKKLIPNFGEIDPDELTAIKESIPEPSINSNPKITIPTTKTSKTAKITIPTTKTTKPTKTTKTTETTNEE